MNQKQLKKEILKNVRGLFETGSLTDVMFNVQGRQFKAHRCILASGSEYFKRMFTGPLANRGEIVNIDVDPDAFKIVLQILYFTNKDKSDKDIISEQVAILLVYFQVYGFNIDSYVKSIPFSDNADNVRKYFELVGILYNNEIPFGIFTGIVRKISLDTDLSELDDDSIITIMSSEAYTSYTNITQLYNIIVPLINSGHSDRLLSIFNYNVLPPFIKEIIPPESQAMMTGPLPRLEHNILETEPGKGLIMLRLVMRYGVMVTRVNDDGTTYVIDGDGNEYLLDVTTNQKDPLTISPGDILTGYLRSKPNINVQPIMLSLLLN